MLAPGTFTLPTHPTSLLVHFFKGSKWFPIHPLPPEIVAWLASLLFWQPFNQSSSQEPMRSKFSLGNDTQLNSNPLQSQMAHILTNFLDTKNIEYS
jgi:hypothetical protein